MYGDYDSKFLNQLFVRLLPFKSTGGMLHATKHFKYLITSLIAFLFNSISVVV